MAWREIEKEYQNSCTIPISLLSKEWTTLSIYKICAKRTHRKLLFCFCNVCREYCGENMAHRAMFNMSTSI